MMLSDVCCVHPVGGRRVRPAGWMARIGRSGPAQLGRPGSRLPLRASVAGLGGAYRGGRQPTACFTTNLNKNNPQDSVLHFSRVIKTRPLYQQSNIPREQ